MKKQTLLSDILLLTKLYAPKDSALFVFDPFEKMNMDVEYPLCKIEEKAFKVLISLADEIVCYKGMPLEEFDLIIDFGKSDMPPAFQQKKWNYINSPNEGIRWLYSDKNKQASFLNFYNTATLKAKIIAKSIKLGLALGMNALVRSGKLSIYHQANLKINQLVGTVPHDDYSVFMGTNDANRTLLLELNTLGVTTHFIKIPTNDKSKRSITNERKQLSDIAAHSFESFTVPSIATSNYSDVLITENIAPQRVERSNELTPLHYNALHEMATKTIRFNHFKSTVYWEQIVGGINRLKNGKHYSSLTNQLDQLKEELTGIRTIYTSMAHADFTPWNMYVSENKLAIYDWEMSQKEMPLLFDLFHFHFQTGVLSDQITVKEIQERIAKACEQEKIKSLIQTYGIDVAIYFKLYLTKTISYYLNAFQLNKGLSVQHEWLLKAWEEVLTTLVVSSSKETQRVAFIKSFHTRLKRTAHAYLKFTEERLEDLKPSSDIDVLVLKEDIQKIIRFCSNEPTVARVKAHRKSFMTTIELYFKDDSFLSIDLINQFKRKGMEMLSAKRLLTSAVVNDFGVRVPLAKFDFEYCFLFYTLNGASIPERYNTFYERKNQEMNGNVFNYIHRKYELLPHISEDVFSNTTYCQQKVGLKLEQSEANSRMNGWSNKFNYLLDTVRDIFFKKGMVITFSGVDGAGKTTIINEVKEKLASKYRKEVVLLRHRPGILPILSAMKHGKKEAEHIASVTMPRKGKNNNVLSSLLRFSYYFTDYMIGQVYVYVKYVLRGKIVLYDRYYFDFINDAKRSNIQLNRSFLKSLYRLVFKPRLNFFLYADASTILARKKEMIAPEIDLLTARYKKLFNQMSEQYKHSQYTIIENKELEVTLQTIMKNYLKVA